MIDLTLHEPEFLRFLSAIDDDLAARTRRKGCGFCSGVLHSARYPRKPRGGPSEPEGARQTTRHSFCCERCRRRTTPTLRSLSRANGLSGLHRRLAERHAVRRHRSSSRRIAGDPGRGAPNPATLASMVARVLRANATLGDRTGTTHGANRARSVAGRPVGAFPGRRCQSTSHPMSAIHRTRFGARRDQAT